VLFQRTLGQENRKECILRLQSSGDRGALQLKPKIIIDLCYFIESNNELFQFLKG